MPQQSTKQFPPWGKTSKFHHGIPSLTVDAEVYTADAVLRSKLLYGLESAQLIPSVLKKLETFQLKVLRKILKIDTTYINRVNSNASVFNRINTMMEEEGRRKRVISFVDAYKK